MAGKPIATVTSMHVCPMVTGAAPHVGGPVIGPGASNILINGKPAALLGDLVTCIGPPDMIVTGNPSVLFNGVPVACVGDMTAHGGVITIGEGNVMIGSATPEEGSLVKVKEIKMPKTTLPNAAILPKKEIPFPKVTTANKVVAKVSGHGNKLKEAQQNQQALKEAKKHGYLSDYSFSV